MLAWIMRRHIDAFGKRWNYGVDYMQWMLRVSPRAMRHYTGFLALSAWRGALPKPVWHAIRVTSAQIGDCGPCVQLIVRMAEADGLAAETLRALLTDDDAAMAEEIALGWHFARAALAHAPETDALREEIARRWGDSAVLGAGLAVATTQLFPALKYALGYGHTACAWKSRVG